MVIDDFGLQIVFAVLRLEGEFALEIDSVIFFVGVFFGIAFEGYSSIVFQFGI